MKTKLIDTLLVSFLVLAGCNSGCKDANTLPDSTSTVTPLAEHNAFSVSATKRVCFSTGNLVYDGHYFFAANPYDGGSLFSKASAATENNKVFGGWDSLSAEGWRTLSDDEWQYLVWERPDGDKKNGLATLCGVHGLVILPDDWQGKDFKPAYKNWNTNVYDSASWAIMEQFGAVFLPAAGYSDGIEENDVGDNGYYWSTPINDTLSYYLFFFDYGVGNGYYYGDEMFRSVRLVKDL